MTKMAKEEEEEFWEEEEEKVWAKLVFQAHPFRVGTLLSPTNFF